MPGCDMTQKYSLPDSYTIRREAEAYWTTVYWNDVDRSTVNSNKTPINSNLVFIFRRANTPRSNKARRRDEAVDARRRKELEEWLQASPLYLAKFL